MVELIAMHKNFPGGNAVMRHVFFCLWGEVYGANSYSCVQVFHYVAHYTWGKVDMVGYLQIPTFFLLSGFCLALGTFQNSSHL